MHVSVVHVKPESFHETKGHVRKVAENAGMPDIKSIPGFHSFYAFEDDGWVTSVAIFEDESGKDKWWEMCKATYSDVWDTHVRPKPGTVKWSSGHVTQHHKA